MYIFGSKIKHFIYGQHVFPNCIKGWGIFTLFSGMGNFAGRDFFIRGWESEEERSSPWTPFSKLKATFSEY